MSGDLESVTAVVRDALDEMTEAVREVTTAVRDQARVFVELEEIREGLAELDSRISAVARGEYQAAVRSLREERQP